MKRILLVIIFFIGANCFAQEYLDVFSYSVDDESTEKLRGTSVVVLPFFDDFTATDFVLDANKWQNNSALVNSGFPIFPTNYNAVTLDILDATGKVYHYASSSPFIADSLISNPISLVDENGEKLTPADSVYLSFYYQPQGNGDAPEINDSLVLMFGYLSDGLMCWDHVWSTPGMSLDTFMVKNDNQYFKQVMIPVKDDKYFQNEIQILFYNYGSLPSSMYPNNRSNVDNWNIDFVYLDKNRSSHDITYPLATFSEKSPSLLKRYQSMPYRQYVSNPTVAMATEYRMFIANLDSVAANTQYTCHIQNRSSDWSFDYSSKWCVLQPFTASGFQNCDGDNSTQACPRLKNFLFDMDSSVDTASYLVTHIISVDAENTVTKGDTMYGIQKFYNYYAYDDGIPERGYGVVPEDSYFASQFSVSLPDTLRGVYMLFNRTYGDANYDFFDIVVWNDNNGRPGNEIYRLKNQRPIWDDEDIFKFSYYSFDDIVRVNGLIYVGVMQHSEESINIGFDTSKDNSQYNFYDSGYGWENSTMKGSLMIRPVLGCDILSLDEDAYVKQSRLVLYPNPSTNMVNISGLDPQSCDEIVIFDMTGRLMKSYSNDVNLDVSDLPCGFYMMRVVTGEGKSYTEKFVISR